jgi:hypothetical protein
MNKFRFTIKIMALAIFTFAFASMAQAQATRTWVSGVGDDANPCSRTAPCKTFAGAISKTAVNGEIDALDPGGFGAVTITKSITIDACCMASILVSGTNGIVVSGAGIIVRVRHVSFQGLNGSGLSGVSFSNGASLTLEDCAIYGFSVAGVTVPSSTQSNELHLKNVSIYDCNEGVHVTNSGTFATLLTFDHVNIARCSTGLNAGNGTRGQIAFSVFGQNTTNGISASQTTSTTDFAVNDSSIVGLGATVGSTVGISTNSSTHVRIARVVITNNVNALGLGGSVDTGGNNTIMGNGTNQDPNGTLFIQK